jgi:cell division septum initiation protein DivIVA
MGVYEQIKTAFQDIIAPELHALRSDMQRVDQKIDSVDSHLSTKIDSVDSRLSTKIDSVDSRLSTKIDALKTETLSMKAELLAEIRRLDARIDSLDRELKTAIEIRERLVALEARLHS